MRQQERESDSMSSGTAAGAKKGLVAIGVIVALIIGYTHFRESFSLESLATKESALRAYQSSHPIFVYGAAFLIYVIVTGLSLPGAAAMTLILAWFFGFWPAVVVVSFASTTGATLAFLLSRYLLRDSIQKQFADRLIGFNKALEREGAFYLFTLRLIPAVPFFVINVVMGLTPIRTGSFWWVSQVGMLPGTAVFVYAGSTVPDLTTLAERGAGSILSPELITAFAVLGIFPLVVKRIMGKLRPAQPQANSSIGN